jgi:glycosyltransferase involved in cell wall biosynthesis
LGAKYLTPFASTPPLLSVIVPVYNEIGTVKDALDAILAKQVAGWQKEVIIIESNSSDGTHDVVRDYIGKPSVRVILEDKAMGKGHAVNAVPLKSWRRYVSDVMQAGNEHGRLLTI